MQPCPPSPLPQSERISEKEPIRPCLSCSPGSSGAVAALGHTALSRLGTHSSRAEVVWLSFQTASICLLTKPVSHSGNGGYPSLAQRWAQPQSPLPHLCGSPLPLWQAICPPEAGLLFQSRLPLPAPGLTGEWEGQQMRRLLSRKLRPGWLGPQHTHISFTKIRFLDDCDSIERAGLG